MGQPKIVLAIIALQLSIGGCAAETDTGAAAAGAHETIGWSSDSVNHGSSGPLRPYYQVWDDFNDGFSVGAADSRWFYFSAGPYVGDDGIETTGAQGLTVRASGTNEVTGEPAFTNTLAQEGDGSNPFGLPGGLDHVKWLVYMNHLSSNGVPGFDAEHGRELSCESWMDGESFGNAGHPFGSAVDNANDDLRLGSVAMNTLDFESFMVFDFFITNETVYAFYERLPFARPFLGDYAAFSYQIPVASHTPGQMHHMKIAYDRDAGVVRWILDGQEVFRVDRIGFRIDREFMTIDHGGTEQLVEIRQLACGMGMFTLLDAALPSDTALVRLSDTPDFYYDPAFGPPALETFVDEDSLLSSRLFGQGTELRVRRYTVSSLPSRR